MIISADTDFGTLLALRQVSKLSIILFRRGVDRLPQKQVALLIANLPAIVDSLDKGAIVVSEGARVRVRDLPIGGN